MEWTPDLAAAEWLVERVDDSYATIHGAVSRGFDAYARIFHPASVRTYLDGRESSLRPSLTPEELKARIARIVDRPVTWAQTAQAFGTTFHRWPNDIGSWAERSRGATTPSPPTVASTPIRRRAVSRTNS